MNKNRIGYIILLACLAVLVFLYSNPFLLFLLILLIVLMLCMAVLIRIDAKNLQVDLQVPSGVQEGKNLKISVTMQSKYPLYVARSILVELDIEHVMFGNTERKYYFMYISAQTKKVEITLPMEYCGEMKIQCVEIRLQDLLKLFRRKIEPFESVETIVYPRGVNVLVEMSRATVGAPREEGRMQNRRGNDPSEMFDIREYVPGDDIRSIHWKLSSKTEQLILRESSEPSHYNMVLLPDFGRKSGDMQVSREEINTAVAFGTAIGEQFLRLGCAFCMAVPLEQGLHLCEVRDRRDFRQMMMQWLGSPIPEQSGQALQYFMSEHMQQQFTRVLILSAGAYQRNLNVLSGQIGSTVVSARGDLQALATSVNGDSEIIEIPVEKRDELYRIIC